MNHTRKFLLLPEKLEWLPKVFSCSTDILREVMWALPTQCVATPE